LTRIKIPRKRKATPRRTAIPRYREAIPRKCIKIYAYTGIDQFRFWVYVFYTPVNFQEDLQTIISRGREEILKAWNESNSILTYKYRMQSFDRVKFAVCENGLKFKI